MKYLKDVKLRYADDTENLKKYTDCDDVVRVLHTRLNHMYHTCGIRDTLLFYASEALRTIQDMEDSELLMIADHLPDLLKEGYSDKTFYGNHFKSLINWWKNFARVYL